MCGTWSNGGSRERENGIIMAIYIVIFIAIFLNGMAFGKRKKWFVVTSFLMLFGVAALRKYTVGIDLLGHYASNYEAFASMSWDQVLDFVRYSNSYYDPGFILFMRLIASVSDNVQWFIIVTSAICYGLVGRYIYKFSDDVVLETMMFITTYTYFMYMNIIAQALALSIIMFGMEFLHQKSYVKYALTVLVAACLHSSAIVCFIFIPLNMLRVTKVNVRRFAIISIGFVLGVDRLLPIVLKYVFPQFAYYFESESSIMDASRFMQLMIYVMCLCMGIVFLYCLPSRWKHSSQDVVGLIEHGEERRLQRCGLNVNMLLYMTILSVVFRLLVVKFYIFSRMGFYFYLFAYSLLATSLQGIKSGRLRLQMKCCVYIVMFLFFVFMFGTVKPSYGVVPYEFFWD